MFSWIAIYYDGTVLPQYNEDGSENKYTDIDRTKLTRFGLVNENGDITHAIHIDPAKGQRLICRMRAFKKDKQIIARGYLVGWQMLVAGQNVQMIALVFENGAIEITNGFKKDHPWLDEIVFLPEEKV